MWALWWVWFAAALVFAIIEIVVPSFLFLGFAIGAGFVGALLLIGVPIATSLPMTMVIFATLSLIAWMALRRFVGVRQGQVKYWDRDINDD